MSSFTREDTTFDSHGTPCAAWRYRPDGVERPPIIVMAHGFGATRALRLAAYAERFAEAGFAVLAFDYRGWGDSAGEPRRVLDIGSQQEDWRAAIAHARRLDGVDRNQVVAWGTSFGGGHALHLASGDRRLAAVVVQVPHISGPASAFARSPRLLASLTLAGLRDQLGAVVGRQPYRLPVIGEPGTVAMLTLSGALPMLERLAGERYEELLPENDVGARVALRVPFYSPGRVAGNITAPVLVQLAKKDDVTPYETALKVARRIPLGEVLTYECGHFDPYVDPLFDTIVSDQIDFLRRNV